MSFLVLVVLIVGGCFWGSLMGAPYWFLWMTPIWVFQAWQLHREMRSAGQVNVPWFSWGRRRVRTVQKRTYPVAKRATPTVNQKRLTARPLTKAKTGSPYGLSNRPSRSQPSIPPVQPISPQPAATTPQTKPPAPPAVSASLLYKLDKLTKSRQTSDRLVDGVAFKYPGKSRRWCTEKAIADLERDRQ